MAPIPAWVSGCVVACIMIALVGKNQEATKFSSEAILVPEWWSMGWFTIHRCIGLLRVFCWQTTLFRALSHVLWFPCLDVGFVDLTRLPFVQIPFKSLHRMGWAWLLSCAPAICSNQPPYAVQSFVFYSADQLQTHHGFVVKQALSP
jgi:hypothetical protein